MHKLLPGKEAGKVTCHTQESFVSVPLARSSGASSAPTPASRPPALRVCARGDRATRPAWRMEGHRHGHAGSGARLHHGCASRFASCSAWSGSAARRCLRGLLRFVCVRHAGRASLPPIGAHPPRVVRAASVASAAPHAQSIVQARAAQCPRRCGRCPARGTRAAAQPLRRHRRPHTGSQQPTCSPHALASGRPPPMLARADAEAPGPRTAHKTSRRARRPLCIRESVHAPCPSRPDAIAGGRQPAATDHSRHGCRRTRKRPAQALSRARTRH